MTTQIAATVTTVYVRLDGNSQEVFVEGVSFASPDAQIKTAVANAMDRNTTDFNNAVVVREGAQLILRPAAVYG